MPLTAGKLVGIDILFQIGKKMIQYHAHQLSGLDIWIIQGRKTWNIHGQLQTKAADSPSMGEMSTLQTG